MSRKRNTFSKAIGHLKSTKIDEKFGVLNEIPTNNTLGVTVPDAGTNTIQQFDGNFPDQATVNFEINGSDGKDTSGLFDSEGNSKLIGPPGDNSYILGPMSAMYYTWAYPTVWTMFGYIREADRRMVNLGWVYSTLDEWDQKEESFGSYGQLTYEQALWFANTKKKDGAGNTPNDSNYYAFYPGPPSNTPDQYGRYACIITGTAKADKDYYDTYAPLGDQAADNFSAMMGRKRQTGPSGEFGADEWDLDKKYDYDGDGEDAWESDPRDAGIDWEKVGGYVDTALTIADAGLMVASLIGILIPEPATSVAGAAGVASVLSKLRWANKARNLGSLAKGLKGMRVGATGLKSRGFRQLKHAKSRHFGSKGLLTPKGGGVYSADTVGRIGPGGLRPGSGGARYVKGASNPFSRASRGGSDAGGVVGSVVPGGARRLGSIEKQNVVNTKTFQKGQRIFNDVVGGKYRNSATANRIRTMARQAGFGGGQSNVPFKNIPQAPNITQSVRGATKNLVRKTKSYINKGKYQQMPGEDTARVFGKGGLLDNDISQMGKFIKKASRGKDPSKLTPADFEGGPIPTNLDQLGQFVQGKGGAAWSFSRGRNTGPTPLGRQLVTRGAKQLKKVGGKIKNLWKNEYDLEGNIIMEAVENKQDVMIINMMKKPKFVERLPEIIKGFEDELELLQILDMMGGIEDGPGELSPDNPLSTEDDPWALRKQQTQEGIELSESKRSILKNLKEPVVLPETKQKSYKVNPGKRKKDKTNYQGMDKLVGDIKPQTPFKTKRNVWSKEWQDYNARQSQNKKNEVLEKVGDGKFAFNYMLNDSRKMNAEQLEKFWGLHPEMYSYFYNGKKYKALRKEQVKGDYVVFMEDENGVKSNMLQSELNLKLSEEHEKQLLAEYNEIQSEKDPTPFLKDPLMKKVAKRLKNEIDYEGKPAVKGYPNEPPPEMVKGFHPKYGKSYKYDKLDPVSAVMMSRAPTGDPEIDANVKKAAKKAKPKVNEEYSDWRKDVLY